MAHGREHLMNWRILYKGQIFEQTSKIKKKKKKNDFSQKSEYNYEQL